MYPTFGISVNSKDGKLGKVSKILTKCDRMRKKISGFRAFAMGAKKIDLKMDAALTLSYNL